MGKRRTNQGGRRRKRRTHLGANNSNEETTTDYRKAGAARVLAEMHYKPAIDSLSIEPQDKIPRSFVVRKGRISKPLQQLIIDIRKLMAPNTALKLKDRANAHLKDYLSMSQHFKVSHVVSVSETSAGPVLKIAKTEAGPTETFRIKNFCLGKTLQERARKKKPLNLDKIYESPPLVVLNNFTSSADGEKISKQDNLTSIMFQSMFPKINVKHASLKTCRRTLLFNLNKDSNLIEVRQYLVSSHQKNVTKSLKKVIHSKGKVDLTELNEISEILDSTSKVKSGKVNYATSDSEAEEDLLFKIPRKFERIPVSHKLDRKINKRLEKLTEIVEHGDAESSATASNICAVNLVEIGPRLDLQLIKIEDGVFTGEVTFHAFKKKTDEEVSLLKKRKLQQAQLKQQRKETQLQNVERKKKKKDGQQEKHRGDMEEDLGSSDDSETEKSDLQSMKAE